MRRGLRAIVLALVAGAGVGGCYTEYAVRPVHCRAVWVPGHYGPWGRWRRRPLALRVGDSSAIGSTSPTSRSAHSAGARVARALGRRARR